MARKAHKREQIARHSKSDLYYQYGTNSLLPSYAHVFAAWSVLRPAKVDLRATVDFFTLSIVNGRGTVAALGATDFRGIAIATTFDGFSAQAKQDVEG